VETRLRAWEGQDRVENFSEGPELIEDPVALALVPCILVELTFLEFCPQSLGRVEQRPIRRDAIPAVQAATGGLLSVICHERYILPGSRLPTPFGQTLRQALQTYRG
jgi:hypothetical protein